MKSFSKAIVVAMIAIAIYVWTNPNAKTAILGIRGVITGYSPEREALEPKYLEQRNAHHSPSHPPSPLHRCLVTGSSRGLGKAAVVELLALGCNSVIMGQRGGGATADEVESIAEKGTKGNGGGAAKVVSLDLSKKSSVTGFVKTLKDESDSVMDVVVLNAALVPAKLKLTEDNFEEGFRVNFLGHFHLVNELIANNLISSSATKIVIVTSECHKIASPLDEEQLGKPVNFTVSGALERYGHSKLCLTTFAQELARRGYGVHLYDPGPVNTDIHRDAPEWLRGIVKPMMEWWFKSPEESARPIGHLALMQPQNPPHYLVFWTNSTVKEEATDEKIGKMLWRKAEELLLLNQ